MADSLERIRKALEAGPTDGEWSQEHRMGFEGFWNTEVFDAAGMAIATLNWLPRPTVDGVTGTYREANAAFIAAANPVAIRSLLAREAALREALEVAGKAISAADRWAIDASCDGVDEDYTETEAHALCVKAGELARAALASTEPKP